MDNTSCPYAVVGVDSYTVAAWVSDMDVGRRPAGGVGECAPSARRQ